MKTKIVTALTGFALLFLGCQPKPTSIDLIVYNAEMVTVDEAIPYAQAMAIDQGQIIAIGSTKALLQKFKPNQAIDLEGKTVLPGLIDAHTHLYALGLAMQQVDLVGTRSKDEVIERLRSFEPYKNANYIVARGWDQNDWEDPTYPSKQDLDAYFPDTPVALSRVDGHALWVNSAALDLAEITADLVMEGGSVLIENGAPSGILIDTPCEKIFETIPSPSRAEKINALLQAQEVCFSFGLTTVNEAGLDRQIIELIDSLQQADIMQLKVYAMAENTPKNRAYYFAKGPYKTPRLNVRSIKVYGDGALGSRGAALRQPYWDQPHHFGAMITDESVLMTIAQSAFDAGFQMNTHAIGDSANVSVLRVYEKVLAQQKDMRWKIEHAQVIPPTYFSFFSNNIIPSVQPTHATSDMYWAEERLGPVRILGAYAYKSLLEHSGIIALGTDFPVEKVNPMLTFYAAVARQDLDQFPENGFMPEQMLSRMDALKGMTIWAAYSNFEEAEKGSLSVGKSADFIVLDQNPLTCSVANIPKIQVLKTYSQGQQVY